MRKQKTRLEIWEDAKKVKVDGLISCVVSSKVTATHVVFFISELPVYKLLQESKGYLMEALENQFNCPKIFKVAKHLLFMC